MKRVAAALTAAAAAGLGAAYGIYHLAFFQRPKLDIPTAEEWAQGSRFLPQIRENVEFVDSLPCDYVHITADDGTSLSARYCHEADDAPIAIIMHGYRSTAMRDTMGLIVLCKKLGYNLLMPVTVQAGETAEAAVQYETAGKASDTAIQTAVDANHWTWQTGDENIATVNSQGVVTGLHGGETTLTLTDASGGLTASCTVQVTNPLRELILNDIVLYLDERTEIVLDYDGTERISHYPSSHASILCRFVPEDATGREPVTYQIADESIAKLDGQWLVPVAYGTTTLTATCSGKTATATVTVVRIPEEIHLNIKEIRLKPGETVQLSAEFEPADADLYTALRWTTDTRSVATVDENGLVTAVGPGYTYIRATSTLSDYPEGYCDVTVENGE